MKDQLVFLMKVLILLINNYKEKFLIDLEKIVLGFVIGNGMKFLKKKLKILLFLVMGIILIESIVLEKIKLEKVHLIDIDNIEEERNI